MVAVQRATNNARRPWATYLPAGILLALMLLLIPRLFDDHSKEASAISHVEERSETAREVAAMADAAGDKKEATINSATQQTKETPALSKPCPYRFISDLTEEEQHPVKGPRHMVTPPEGGNLHLLCCHTTKGPLNALMHEKWAPRGAQRVLEMVKSGYFHAGPPFNGGVPMMRCLKNFLCQFGLNNNPTLSKLHRKNFPDDPNWLPEGPAHRKNEDGVERFAHGYMAYAGGGKDSRTNQLIVSLKDVQSLAGGSPWEVPWGELVGSHSFETLGQIYFGYGEKGPPQGKLGNRGMTEEMKQEFPQLDYVTECAVVDEQLES